MASTSNSLCAVRFASGEVLVMSPECAELRALGHALLHVFTMRTRKQERRSRLTLEGELGARRPERAWQGTGVLDGLLV